MSKLDELLRELCPDGVEYKKLGEIATISRGGNFQKKDFLTEGVPCIHYGQIYTKYGLFTDKTFTFISEECAKKQKMAQPNDIVMAVTSENIEDVCKCLAWLGDEPVAVSGHSAIIHHNQNAKYLVYYFHSQMFFAQKRKLAHGTKVIEVTPDALANITLPVPPAEIQHEVVRVLDSYTENVAELQRQLTAELTARQKQYEFYRDKLLTFNVLRGGTIDFDREILCRIADLGKWSGGKTPSMAEKKYWESGTIPWVSSKDVKQPILSDTIDHITNAAVDEASMTVYPAGSVAIVTRSGILRHTFPVTYIPFETTVNQDIKILVTKEGISSRYVSHALQAYGESIRRTTKKQGGTVDSLDFQKVLAYKIPVPPLDVQNRIVNVLDNFEKICSDLNIGLPAEIEARQKQYEYYRDKLLTFAETSNTILSRAEQSRAEQSRAEQSRALIKLLQYVFGYAVVTLEDIAENCDSMRKPVTSGKREAGEYPYYGASGIVDYVKDYIFDGDYLLVSEDGANLLARSTPIAFSISGKNWVNNHAHVLKFDRYETRRFVEFYLNSIDLAPYISGGAQPKLNQKNLNRIEIPLPSQERQKYIVDILDRFDAICNDLTSGLPAEMEARQKQYEYYRDKLLTFKEVAAT